MIRTIIEPFRIKMVEPIPLTTEIQRTEWLATAHYNPFLLHGSQVTIDLLTDSGTGAMSTGQWAAMMRGDETYAGSESYYELADAVRGVSGMKHIIPTHQGRAAEHILLHAIGVSDKKVVANAHFDTTRANVLFLGGEPVDLVIDEAYEPQSEHPFKGNIDLDKLAAFFDAHAHETSLLIMTVTNNTGGGHPVSLENLRAASAMARKHGIPVILDAARFAENAWFIHQREPGYADRSPADIAREMFALADGFTMSAKKDGLVNIGGLLCMNDDALASKCKDLLILTEGFPTYGGLAGRDLAALAVGIKEVLEGPYLEYRIASVKYFFRMLDKLGIPLMRPAGGHAVYIDAQRFYPHIPAHQFPGVALANAMYLKGGVRAVEIGSLMFGGAMRGKHGGRDPLELVRLTIPRRTYTQSHVDYMGEVLAEVWAERGSARGYSIVWEAPVLRAFTARLKPV